MSLETAILKKLILRNVAGLGLALLLLWFGLYLSDLGKQYNSGILVFLSVVVNLVVLGMAAFAIKTLLALEKKVRHWLKAQDVEKQ